MVDAPKGNVELLPLAFRHWFQVGGNEGEKAMACAVCTSDTLIDEQMECVGQMRTLMRALNKGPTTTRASNKGPKWYGFIHKGWCDCLKETARAAADAAAAAVSSDGREHGNGGGAGSADGADPGEAGQVDTAAAAASSESGEHGDGGGTGGLAAQLSGEAAAAAAAVTAAARAVSSSAGGVHGDGGGTGGLAAPPADDNAAAQDGSAASLRASDLDANVVGLDSNRDNEDLATPMKFEPIPATAHNPGSTRPAQGDAQAVAPYARITGQILNGTHVAADVYRIRGDGSCLAIALLLSIFSAHKADPKLVQQLQANSQRVWLEFAKIGQDLSEGKDLSCFAFREWIYLSALLNSFGFRDRLETPPSGQPEQLILPLARATATKAHVGEDVFDKFLKCDKCMYAARFLDTSVYIEEPILGALFGGPLEGVGLMVFETHRKGKRTEAFFNRASSINLEAAILIPILFETCVADASRRKSKAQSSSGEGMLGNLATRSTRSSVNKAAPSEEEIERQLAAFAYDTNSKKNHINRLIFQGGKHVLCRNDLPNRCLLPSRIPCLLPSLPPSLAPSLVRSTSSVSTLAPSLCPHTIPSLSFPRALQASIPRSLALSLPCNLPSSCFITCGGIPSLRLFAAACGRRDLDS